MNEGKEHSDRASMRERQKNLWQHEIKAQWLDRRMKEPKDRIDLMTVSKKEKPAGAIEPGKKENAV